MRETFVPIAVAALVLVSAWSSRDPKAIPQGPVLTQGPVEPPETLEARVAWIVDRAWEERALEALVGVVELRGEVIATVARGELDGAPADAATPFPSGTAAELLLALAVLHEADERGVELDTPIAKLLPARDLPWDGVTLDMLLRHTSGLGDVTPAGRAAVEASSPREVPDEPPQDDPQDGSAPARAASQEDAPAPAEAGRREVAAPWLDDARAVAELAEPGERFDWSNTNVLLAHLWLEETTGRTLAEYAAAELLPELGVAGAGAEEEAGESASVAFAAPGDWARARLDLGRLLREDAWWPPELQLEGVGLGAEHLLALAAKFEERGLLAIDPGPPGGPARAGDDDAEGGAEGTARPAAAQRGDAAREDDGSGYGWHETWLESHDARAHGGAFSDGAVRIASYPDLELTVAFVARGGTESLASLEQAVTRAVLDLPQPGLADLPLTLEELGRYQGVYHIGSTRLVLAVRDERLELRTNEAVHALAFQGGERFLALDGRELSLVFRKDGEGRATGFLLHRDGIDANAVRFE